MADFLIRSLRGGLNEDPPTSLADDQCTAAQNVEYSTSMLGERRLGGLAIDLTGSPLAGCDAILWLHRHLPTASYADAQLWALGVMGGAAVLAYKDTAWHQVTMPDAIVLNGSDEWTVTAQSFNSKLFIAYLSAVDRLHVWEPGLTELRRVGMTVPTIPMLTATETGTGTLAGARWYRARYITKDASGVIVRRSEPSPGQFYEPPGTGAIIHLATVPLGDGETHWELEAGTDSFAYYRIGTDEIHGTISDTTDYAEGYARSFPLSESSGEYEPWPSVKLLTVDQNRLMGAYLWNRSAADKSSVIWSAVLNAPGVNNDERVPLASSNALGLDANEGGPLTCLSATINGYVYATKASAVYQLTRTGLRAHAYDAICLTKQRGALHSSLVEAFDQTGQPSMFMLDPHIGACHIGARGVEPCGMDVRRSWATVNLDATINIARGLYYPEKQQIHWRVATASGFVRFVLHTQEMRQAINGLRGGWTIWNGGSAAAGTWCLFSDNISTNGPRNNTLRPFLGFVGQGLIWQMEQGDTDNGTAYHAEVRTKPYVHGSLLNQFEAHSAMLLAAAIPGGVVDVTLRGDFGTVQTVTHNVRLDPVGAEMRVIRNLDDLGLAELRTLQVVFADSTLLRDGGDTMPKWSLEQFAVREVGGATA